jgi:hypothetical protein
VYAQKAGWDAKDAEGFIKIAGNSAAIGASKLAKSIGASAEITHKPAPKVHA